MIDLMSKKSFVDPNNSTHVSVSPDLTEEQKACLRLVAQHHISKKIAFKFSIMWELK